MTNVIGVTIGGILMIIIVGAIVSAAHKFIDRRTKRIHSQRCGKTLECENGRTRPQAHRYSRRHDHH